MASIFSFPRSAPRADALRTISVSVTIAAIPPSRSTSKEPTRSSRIRRAASWIVASYRIVFNLDVIRFCSVFMVSSWLRSQHDFTKQFAIVHAFLGSASLLERHHGIDCRLNAARTHPFRRIQQLGAGSHHCPHNSGLPHIKIPEVKRDRGT